MDQFGPGLRRRPRKRKWSVKKKATPLAVGAGVAELSRIYARYPGVFSKVLKYSLRFMK